MNGIRSRVALLGALSLLLALAIAAAAAARPAVKNGGTLVIGLTAGEPDVLDPTLARTFSGREVFTTFCEKLYDLNAKAQAWMKQHAAEYGFINNVPRESWHWAFRPKSA